MGRGCRQRGLGDRDFGITRCEEADVIVFLVLHRNQIGAWHAFTHPVVAAQRCPRGNKPVVRSLEFEAKLGCLAQIHLFFITLFFNRSPGIAPRMANPLAGDGLHFYSLMIFFILGHDSVHHQVRRRRELFISGF